MSDFYNTRKVVTRKAHMLVWANTGGLPNVRAYRLVPPSPSPEAKGETSGPVRYKQVPEIVPGDYGRVRVGVQRDGNPVVALKDRDGVWNAMQPLTPDELLAAGETLIALGKAGKEMGNV